MNNRYSLIIPCFNEQDNIEKTINKIFDNVISTNQNSESEIELILVNDGSTDDTKKIIKQSLDKNNFKFIDLKINKGYGYALRKGISNSTNDNIIIADADATYPLEEIKNLIKIFESSKIDLLVGSRTGKNVTYSNIRKIPKFFLRKWISYLCDYNIPDINSGLRIFKKEIFSDFESFYPNGFSFTITNTMVSFKNNYNVNFVDIDYFERVGKSKINPIRDTLNFIYLIFRTGYLFDPLKALGPVILVFFIVFLASIFNDIYNLNISDKSILLFLVLTNVITFAFLSNLVINIKKKK